ncbi:MAG: hypothetical protein GF368_03950 [Candidatus Aenigmarchaeota archaeon]|nr:hypothetical protein [Candidatus Aenigmarchaeota archaeon]
MVEELKELEIDYYELGKSPSLSEHELEEENVAPKDDKIKYEDLVKRKNDNPISVRERLNLLERKTDDLERSLVLVNKGLNGLRKIVNEKLEDLDHLKKTPKVPEELKSELMSLRSVVKNISQVNEEIKQKTPNMLRKLEDKVNNFNEKIGHLDKKLEKLEEETKETYWSRPVVLE